MEWRAVHAGILGIVYSLGSRDIWRTRTFVKETYKDKSVRRRYSPLSLNLLSKCCVTPLKAGTEHGKSRSKEKRMWGRGMLDSKVCSCNEWARLISWGFLFSHPRDEEETGRRGRAAGHQ